MARIQGQKEWTGRVLEQVRQVRASLDSIEQTLAIPRIASHPIAPEWRARVDAAAGDAVEAAAQFDGVIFGAAVEAAGGKERVIELLQRLAAGLAAGEEPPSEGRGRCS